MELATNMEVMLSMSLRKVSSLIQSGRKLINSRSVVMVVVPRIPAGGIPRLRELVVVEWGGLLPLQYWWGIPPLLLKRFQMR